MKQKKFILVPLFIYNALDFFCYVNSLRRKKNKTKSITNLFAFILSEFDRNFDSKNYNFILVIR